MKLSLIGLKAWIFVVILIAIAIIFLVILFKIVLFLLPFIIVIVVLVWLLSLFKKKHDKGYVDVKFKIK